MKKTMLIALSIILALTFTACPEDDDNGVKGSLDKWTAVSNSTFGDSDIRAIAYGDISGYMWVAGGAEGKMAYSWDGIEWTAVEDSTFYYSSTSFGSDGEETISTSYYDIFSIAYGSDGDAFNRFVAGGDNGKMAYSDDGIRWTAVSNSKFINRIEAIAYGNGKFVAGGSNGMAYSDDGTTWTAVEDSTVWEYTDTDGSTYNAYIYAIAYGDGKFIACGTYGKMAYSADGVTWTAVSNNPFPKDIITTIQSIVYGNNRWVAGSINPDVNIAYSANGEDWTAVPLTSSNIHGGIHNIAYGNNRFVASYGEGIVYSANGISWTSVPLNRIFGGGVTFDIAYDGYAGFITVGQNGKMAYANW
jgi:hypothetical protein